MGEGGRGATGSAGEVATYLGRLPQEIGEGEHRQPLLAGMIQGLGYLAGQVELLRDMAVLGWEGPVDWDLALGAKQAMRVYAEHCKNAKGKSLGHAKNYVVIGLFLAAMDMDSQRFRQEQARLEQVVGVKVRGEDGKVTFGKATALNTIVGYGQVAISRKKAFVNLQGKGLQGQEMVEAFRPFLEVQGRQQEEVAPSIPVFKELKGALKTQRMG